jgi:hypothetical protein
VTATACDNLTIFWTLDLAAGWHTPDAPIAVGASADVPFQEQRCTGSNNHNTHPPGVGCGAWYAPSQLVAKPLPITGGSPCPIATTQVAPGTLRLTRTGPGDPRLQAGAAGLTGYCAVAVDDPAHSDATVIVL